MNFYNTAPYLCRCVTMGGHRSAGAIEHPTPQLGACDGPERGHSKLPSCWVDAPAPAWG